MVLIRTHLIFCILAISGHISLVNGEDLQGKVALVTGGARGIGYEIIRELLTSGVKGVTLVDIDRLNGKKAARELNHMYGRGRVIFIPADVSKWDQFETTFKISIQHWNQLDIVVNNAAVFNENAWKLQIDVNVVGTLQGTFLGFEYMSKAKRGVGGTIVNIASVSGIDPVFYLPINSATKSFIIALGRSLGHEVYYDYNNVRIITLCPGITSTQSPDKLGFTQSLSTAFSPYVIDAALEATKMDKPQRANSVGKALVSVLNDGSNGSVWVAEDDEPAYEIVFPDRKAMRKNDSSVIFM